jgi:hypothetical protein
MPYNFFFVHLSTCDATLNRCRGGFGGGYCYFTAKIILALDKAVDPQIAAVDPLLAVGIQCQD